jgi:anaerobic ribonucleoside-triphosphate reductase
LGTRGGQAIFSDLNFYYEVPRRYRDTFALGPGGKFIRRVRDKYGENHDEAVVDLPKNPVMFKESKTDGFLTYQDFELEARRLLKALIKVYRSGDANGMPFFFPKANVHITQDFWRTPEHEGFLELMAEAASANGSLYFIMERGDTNVISQCCRLRVNMTEEELEIAHKEPWRLRFAALQNITLNMPRMAIEAARAGKAVEERKGILLQTIDKFMHVAVDAHIQKKKFIAKLIALKEHGPLAALTYDQDGAPYFNLGSARYLVGVIGLNETVQALCGKQLHESKAALDLGLEIISFMYMNCKKLGAENKINLALEQTPAESTAYRFAKLDLDKYTEAKDLVKGDMKSGSIYYTNSTHMAADAKLGIIDRITMEGLFHGAIDAGSITHGWIGDSTPNTEAMATFIRKIYDLTSNDQVVFSPTFTQCKSCSTVSKGEYKECPKCKGTEVTYVTRVTGYYGEVNKWNKGKQQEREDRVQHTSLVEKENFGADHTVEDIVLYGKPGCSICEGTNEALKTLLKKPEFSKVTYRYEIIDQDKTLEASKKLADMLSKTVREIPALIIHDRTWVTKMPTATTIEHTLQALK